MCLFLSLFGSLLRGKNKRAAANLSARQLRFRTRHFAAAALAWRAAGRHFHIISFARSAGSLLLPFSPHSSLFPRIPRGMFHFIEGGISIVWGTRRQRYDLIGCKSTIKGQVSHSLSHFPLAVWHSKQLCTINCRKQFRKLEEKEKAWCAQDDPPSKFNAWWNDSIMPERQTPTSVWNYTFSNKFHIFSTSDSSGDASHIKSSKKWGKKTSMDHQKRSIFRPLLKKWWSDRADQALGSGYCQCPLWHHKRRTTQTA